VDFHLREQSITTRITHACISTCASAGTSSGGIATRSTTSIPTNNSFRIRLSFNIDRLIHNYLTGWSDSIVLHIAHAHELINLGHAKPVQWVNHQLKTNMLDKATTLRGRTIEWTKQRQREVDGNKQKTNQK
jgi:hypothetical protein